MVIVGHGFTVVRNFYLFRVLHRIREPVLQSQIDKCSHRDKETKNTKFLGLDIDSSLSWKNHVDEMMFKLTRACYAIRYVKHFMSQDTLRTIYFSHFHSILLNGIIFLDNSAYSSNIFKIKKRIIRIIMNAINRDSCRQYSRI